MNRTARRAAADTALAAVYAQIPTIAGCTGRCHTTCGPIGMSHRERQVIAERHGIDIPELPRGPRALLRLADPTDCPALTPLKRCGVYEDRPTICRLWGAVEDLPCVYGCVPDGGSLPPRVGAALLAESLAAGGAPPPPAGGPMRLRGAAARALLDDIGARDRGPQ